MRKHVIDTSGWKLSCLPGSSSQSEILSGSIPLSKSGDINASLRDAAVLPDPHYDMNMEAYFPITASNWLIEGSFDCDGEGDPSVELCFEGIDGTAEICLNGTWIGTAKNAFRPHIFPVGTLLKKQDNRLQIRFFSIDDLLGGPRTDVQDGWEDRRTMLRKPQFNMGWDWAQPVPSWGLCGSIVLLFGTEFRLQDVYVDPRLDGKVICYSEVTKASLSSPCEIRWTLEMPDGRFIQDKYPCTSLNGYMTMQITDPQLWQPIDFGYQPLYRFHAELICGGECLDERSGTFGFRTAELIEEAFTPDAGNGMSFRFRINGKDIFIKGSNWVPLEMWCSEATEEQYRFYLEKAREAHFNMLRVWGGGIYERDLFYDLCDEYGIMVWEDFMFASAGVPFDLLRDEIVAEACHQLTRLRNHPCIVIWCGCNENFASWRNYESAAKSFREGNARLSVIDQKKDGPGEAGKTQSDIETPNAEVYSSHTERTHSDPLLYTMLLRGLVSRYGLGVPYIESSPLSHDDTGNMPQSGNSHLSCWKYALFETDGHYERWRDHFERVCSFDSEFCIQGPCSEEYLRSFLRPEHYWPPDEVWIRHIQRGHQRLPHFQQTMWIAGASFGEVRSLTDYVKFGQATHMEQTRAEYESARQDFPNNGGTMAWMYNDCWPTANWSIIDYGRNPKPAYYAAKRACAPLLPIIFERNGRVCFSVSNQTGKDVLFEIRYGAVRLDGTILLEKHTLCSVSSGQTVLFDRLRRENLPADIDTLWFIRAAANGESLPTVTYFPNGWKDVPFRPSGAEVHVMDEERTGSRFRYRLAVRTKDFGRYLCLKAAPGDAWFSDNYFDLLPGEERIVTAEVNEPVQFLLSDWCTGIIENGKQ